MERDGGGYGRVDANWEVAQIEIVFVLPTRLGGKFGEGVCLICINAKNDAASNLLLEVYIQSFSITHHSFLYSYFPPLCCQFCHGVVVLKCASARWVARPTTTLLPLLSVQL